MNKGIALFVAVAMFGCSTTNIPRANTRAEVRAYVERAAAVVAREGGAACAALAEPAWFSGEWYIFVSEVNGPTVCHPARPDLIGKLERDLVDPNGKAIGQEFLRLAESPERAGWVDYVWPRPGQTVPVAKSAYVRVVTGPDGKSYLVGSGGYELR